MSLGEAAPWMYLVSHHTHTDRQKSGKSAFATRRNANPNVGCAHHGRLRTS